MSSASSASRQWGAVVKIAVRNLREHKVKTLIIGTIVALGILVLVVGNSVMDTATAGIRMMYIDNFTGDLLITARTDAGVTIFGSKDQSSGTVPRIPDYFAVYEAVSQRPEVASISPQATGTVGLSIQDDQGNEKGRGFTTLFGIDPERYQKTFPNNYVLTAGRFLQPGEDGIVLADSAVAMFKRSGVAVQPGMKLLLTTQGQGGGTIREATVRGIFHFTQSSGQLGTVSLVDMQTMRALLGYTVADTRAVTLTDSQKALAGAVDEASLFGADTMVDTKAATKGAPTARQLDTLLGDTSERDRLAQTDTGAWQYLLVKLKPGTSSDAVQKALTSGFAQTDTEVTVSGWLDGAGPSAALAYTMKDVFNLIVLVIAVVAVIIIMNTLVISISERLGEIGTMRAIGARKDFVRAMILTETLMISVVFGLIGLAAGTAVLLVLGATGLAAPNLFFQVLFGGPVLHPVVSPAAALTAVLAVVVIGLLASLYPVRLALRVRPVQAMQSE